MGARYCARVASGVKDVRDDGVRPSGSDTETEGPAMTADTALTRYVATFITAADAAVLPADVVALGKKSILDGLGLALAGSVAKSGDLITRYLGTLGLAQGPGTV